MTGPAPSHPVLIARNGKGRAATLTKIAPRTGHAIGFDGSSIAFLEGLHGNDRRAAPRALARAVQRWHDITDLESLPETSERVVHVRIAAPEMPA